MNIYIYTHLNIVRCISTYTYLHIYASIHVHTYVHVCTYLYICIYIYINPKRTLLGKPRLRTTGSGFLGERLSVSGALGKASTWLGRARSIIAGFAAITEWLLRHLN